MPGNQKIGPGRSKKVLRAGGKLGISKRVLGNRRGFWGLGGVFLSAEEKQEEVVLRFRVWYREGVEEKRGRGGFGGHRGLAAGMRSQRAGAAPVWHFLSCPLSITQLEVGVRTVVALVHQRSQSTWLSWASPCNLSVSLIAVGTWHLLSFLYLVCLFGLWKCKPYLNNRANPLSRKRRVIPSQVTASGVTWRRKLRSVNYRGNSSVRAL